MPFTSNIAIIGIKRKNNKKKDKEYIFVDDGSDDKSKKKILQFLKITKKKNFS